MQQSQVKLLQGLSENYLIRLYLINNSILIQKPQDVLKTKAGKYHICQFDSWLLTEKMGKNLIMCHSLISISLVDATLGLRHSHLLPVLKSSVESILYFISAIVSQSFTSLIPL